MKKSFVIAAVLAAMTGAAFAAQPVPQAPTPEPCNQVPPPDYCNNKVPEPPSLALVGFALTGMGWTTWAASRRRRKVAL